ncbi:MAG TPA: IS1182 family transposase [Anaerolineae bacterium]|nr:IS1182 family transposase [Anaerolineae bacterium]
MLGHRNPQRSLFSAQSLPHQVDPDSFYGRMGAISRQLFQDDDLQDMYCPDNGRPSLPPSLMSGALLLQFHDDVSDGEAVERTLYDLRWKVALDLPLDFPGFDPSSLSVYRQRLSENGQERYAFDRFVAVGREAGFIPDKVTLLTDTTWVKGAGAVQDTYTLLRKGLRKLLRTLGYHLPGRRQGLCQRVRELVETYVDQDRKAEIDWSDPQARVGHLKVLVDDTEAALELAAEQADDAEVRTIGWLLTKILGDDVVTDEEGRPQIGEGTASGRVISITDPEMRHGRKSASRRFDGFKTSVTTEVTSELIVDIADVPAPGSDGAHLMPTIERVEAHAGVTVERVIADGAYGSGDNRAACAHDPGHRIDLVSPVSQPHDPAVHKSAFQIDLPARRATCPHGYTVTGEDRKDRQGRPILAFTFARSDCETCPLFDRCVHSQAAGRTVCTHAHEVLLQEARQRQQTDEFQVLYRLRGRVEGKIAELVDHGLRETHYRGEQKRQLQRLWTGAAVNLKRLFKLAQAKNADLGLVLAHLRPGQMGLAPG